MSSNSKSPLSNHDIESELRARKIVSATARLELFAYQSSFRRRSAENREHYRVAVDGSDLFHLMLGSNLRAVEKRAQGLFQACPDLVAEPLHHWESAAGTDYLIFTHLRGEPLDTLVQKGSYTASDWLKVVRGVQSRLQKTARLSNLASLEAELDHLIDGVCQMPMLDSLDMQFIREVIRPIVLRGERDFAPTIRWSNGDFIGRNLLVDLESGKVSLVDYEYAAETHFSADDWSRLLHFSALPPGLTDEEEIVASHSAAREAYCWLRQLYLARSIRPLANQEAHIAEISDQLILSTSLDSRSSDVDRPSPPALLIRGFKHWRERHATLEALFKRTEAEREHLHSEWQARGKWGQELDAELHQTRDRLTQLQRELADRTVWAQSLDTKLTQVQADHAAQVDRHTQLELRCNYAEAERERLQIEWQARGKWGLELDAELQQNRDQLAQLRRELVKLTAQAEFSDLQTTKAKADHALQATLLEEHRKRADEVATELTKKTTWIQSLENHLRESQTALSEQTKLAREQLQWNEQLERDLINQTKLAEALQTRIEEIKTSLTHHGKKIAQLESELAYERDALQRSEAQRHAIALESEQRAQDVTTLTAQVCDEQIRASKDLIYFRRTIGMRRRTLGNFVKDLRHTVNLVGDWILGPLLKRPCTHRLRHVTWSLTFLRDNLLMRCGLNIRITGHLHDIDNRPARQIYARLGGRTIVGIMDSEQGHSFTIEFATKPGLKFIRLYAQLFSGVVIPLGYRLLLCLNGPTVDTTASREKMQSLLLKIKLPVSPNPTVSIIIPIFNQTLYTLQCLQAISQNSGNIPYEVIVIDDCSAEREVKLLRKLPQLRYHRNRSNQGFVRNCNLGAGLARGEYVLFLNNDTEVQAGWLSALVETFRLSHDVGMVGAKLIYADGSLQEAGGILWSDGSAWNYGRNDDPSKPEYNYVREVDYASGACLILKGSFFKQLGGFDLQFVPAYCEDSDLAFQVRAAGKRVIYQPQAVVIHHEGKSNGTDTSAGVKRYQITNNEKLQTKWAAELARDHRPNGVDVFRARERSFHRKVILFIDHYLPHYDQDAGSRTIWCYLDFFLKAGFSIKFIGDNFHPHQPYLREMQQKGIEVLWGSWYAHHWERWLEQVGSQIDYVFLSRAHTIRRYLPALRRCTTAKLLFYGHDLISRTLAIEYSITNNANTLAASQNWTAMEDEVFRQVDVVYYPSELETSQITQSRRAKVARTLTPYVFNSFPNTNFGATLNQRSGLLFVGGFRHPPNADAVHWFVREIWPNVVKAFPECHFTIVGSNPPPDIQQLAAKNIVVTGYVSDEKLNSLYAQHLAVVVPLRHGGGIKGKVVEAMWHGIPVITTPVGAEGIPEATECLQVAEIAQFASAVVIALRSPELIVQYADRGPEVVRKHFSTAALQRVFQQDIELNHHV